MSISGPQSSPEFLLYMSIVIFPTAAMNSAFADGAQKFAVQPWLSRIGIIYDFRKTLMANEL